MSWIKGEDFDFNSFLFTERFRIRQIFNRTDDEYLRNMGIVLNANPVVKWYFMHKCPEYAKVIEKVAVDYAEKVSAEEARKAEIFMIEACCDSITYANPEYMAANSGWWTMRDWDKKRLFEFVDFNKKIVLDVGSGSGRLAFAAAEKAAWVYASEPVDMLREFMRDRTKREDIRNIRIVDGIVTELLYPDDTFDIVMSGDVVGDDYDVEIAELTRVCKSGGWLVDSPSDCDEQYEKNDDIDEDDDLVKRGWEALGDGRYRKQVIKNERKAMDIKYRKIDDVILSRIVDEYGDWAKDYIHIKDDAFALAPMDGDFPAGFICVTPQNLDYPLAHLRDAYIEVVEVHENYRRQGIGQHLINCAENWAREAGFKQIRTHSNDKAIEAINMWHKLNYGLCPHVYSAEEGCAGYWVAKVLNPDTVSLNK